MSVVAGPVEVPVNVDLRNLTPAAAELEKSIGRMGDAADRARGTLGGLSGGLDTVRQTGGGASRTLIDLGRAANDSQQFQYGLTQGLIATSNQLDGLVFGFQAMRKEAAAAGTTVTRQLLGALTGAGGLILALNVAATVAVVFGDKIVAAFNDGGKAAEEAKTQINEALEGLIKFRAAERGVEFGSVAEGQRLLADLVQRRAAATERLAAAQQTLGTRTIRTPGVLGGSAGTSQVAETSNAAVQAARADLQIIEQGIARTNSGIQELRRTGRIADLLGLPEAAEKFTPVVRGAARTGRAARVASADFEALAGSGEDAALRIREALAATRREAGGLVDLGEITRAQAATEEVEAFERALRAALKLPEDARGRARALTDIFNGLAEARARFVQATLAETGQIIPPASIRDLERAAVSAEALAAQISVTEAEARRLAQVLPVITLPADLPRGAAEAAAQVSRLRKEAESLAAVGLDVLAGGLTDVLFSLGSGDSALRLAEFDADEERARLRELFDEGSIGAEELRLRLEDVDGRLKSIRQTAPTLQNALVGTFKAVTDEIARAIVKLLLFKAISAGLSLIPGGAGFATALGGVLGFSGAGKTGSIAQAPSASSVSLPPVAKGSASGTQTVRVEFAGGQDGRGGFYITPTQFAQGTAAGNERLAAGAGVSLR